jgi:acyl carrier protein
MMPTLTDLLRLQFPGATFDQDNPDLRIGAFPEWDSLAHFNLLMLIEQECGVRFSMRELAELKSLVDIRSTLREKGVEL